MKTWVVGDIHGEQKKLQEAFENTPINLGDRIIFLGDYVDRGLNSFGVIEFILELQKSYEVITLKGNHDQVFINNLNGGFWKFWDQGQKPTLHSYLKNCAPKMLLNEICPFRWKDLPETHQKFFTNLKSYFQDELGNLFVHGGINRHLQLYEQNDDIFLWDRDLLNSARSYYFSTSTSQGYSFKIKTNNVQKIFVGHTSVQYFRKSTPQTYGPVTVLDLGAGKYPDGKICFMDVLTGIYFLN
jgi:serine/threonine protein phosphatase 1